MNDRLIYLLRRELRLKLKDKTLVSISRDNEENILIVFKPDYYIFFASKPHLLNILYGEKKIQSSFIECFAFRSGISGLDIEGMLGDRCFSLHSKIIHPYKPEERVSMHFEIFGRFNNLIVTRDNKIAFTLNLSRQKGRLLKLGEEYIKPSAEVKLVITKWGNVFGEDLEVIKQINKPLSSFIKCRFALLESLLIKDMFLECKLPLNLSCQEVKPVHLKALAEAWSRYKLQPGLFYHEGRHYVITFIPSLLSGEYKHTPDLSTALNLAFLDTTSDQLFKQQKDAIILPIKDSLAYAEKKLKSLDVYLKNYSNPEVYKTKADLLLAYNDLAEKTNKGYSIPTQPSVEIDARPYHTPIQAAQEYYKQYKKAKKGIKPLHEQITLQEELIKRLKEEISSWEIEEDINRFVLKSRLEKKRIAQGSKPYRRFVSPSGYLILVGRNDKENSSLSHHHAAPDDIWFHVKGITGSHVVIILPNKKSKATNDDILVASRLAVSFSKVKESNAVPVDNTLIKYVRSVKGKPGRVTYSREKTILADPFTKEEIKGLFYSSLDKE